jgi:alginate O-acetyltransferase complex protein AlgI
LGGFLLFRFFQKPRLALSFLFLSSLVFYAYWDARFLLLLLLSILFNYTAGRLLFTPFSEQKKKVILLAAVGANLSLLFYYKYFTFFLSTLSYWLSEPFHVDSLILPLGISFFTFTQIAYLVDVYQKKANSSDFISYALFVTVFPHLIAGPILHHKEMTAQFLSLEKEKGWSTENFAGGLFLFVIGLAKKVLIADQLALLVKPIFDGGLEPVPLFHAWFGAITYTLQLYFDFSGYSDMAVGLGLFFNLHLPINFNSPYKADSMIDFWRRWHISLSTFLRDYLYIPLGGNRKGERSKLRNLFLTMLLGGLWHGAGWTYIIWGACHGLFLMINHAWRKTGWPLPSSLSRALTLLAVIVAWVIFRSPNLETAIHLLKGMSGGYGVVLPASFSSYFSFLKSWGVLFMHLENSYFKGKDLLLLIFLIPVVLWMPNSNEWKARFHQSKYAGVICGVLFLAALLNLKEVTEFLYYQF